MLTVATAYFRYNINYYALRVWVQYYTKAAQCSGVINVHLIDADLGKLKIRMKSLKKEIKELESRRPAAAPLNLHPSLSLRLYLNQQEFQINYKLHTTLKKVVLTL